MAPLALCLAQENAHFRVVVHVGADLWNLLGELGDQMCLGRVHDLLVGLGELGEGVLEGGPSEPKQGRFGIDDELREPARVRVLETVGNLIRW